MPDLDQLRDGLHVSISQIKAYIRCSRAYQLRYVIGVKPAFKPKALALGTSYHAAVARFYVAVKEDGAPPPLPLICDTFRDGWQREVDGDVPLQADEDETDDDGALVDKGIALVGAFYDMAVASVAGVKVEAVEKPFSVEIHDPDTGEVMEERLVGAFDLVVSEGGRHTVVEHKTSARRYGSDQIAFDIQPTGYRIAAKAIGLGDVALKYQVAVKSKTPAVQVVDLARTSEDEDEFRRVAVGVMRAVDAGIFMPLRSWACRSCPHAHACRLSRAVRRSRSTS
ncbi:PD-(D/E)XK nuclease family protein [Anaeromyxobacter sp. SG26]|uniref:PD-(D/E)XK nuclease family protein n=1 Tax=Anaeromyxobacter sp. SG26 TaxID=2925407 RepID=UPI001F5A82BD|nr:PD-(D/E)XK nuclease family protein [Anaeromyxobacter sp. SG26]